MVTYYVDYSLALHTGVKTTFRFSAAIRRVNIGGVPYIYTDFSDNS
jgi:hypothetical protein